jgi:hypothetical protein
MLLMEFGLHLSRERSMVSDGREDSANLVFVDENDLYSSDSEADDPPYTVVGIVNKGAASLGDACYYSNKLSLTAPSADQISFCLPEQHHLTSVASLALAK